MLLTSTLSSGILSLIEEPTRRPKMSSLLRKTFSYLPVEVFLRRIMEPDLSVVEVRPSARDRRTDFLLSPTSDFRPAAAE